MTTSDNTPTNPPDWAAADRPRPIELLLAATSMDDVSRHVIETTRLIYPVSVPTIEALMDAVLANESLRDGRADGYYYQRAIEGVLPSAELRAALILAAAIGGMPGAAAETAHAYAALAVEHARWLRDSARHAVTDYEKAVVRRVEQRARVVRLLATGWSAIAAGTVSDYADAPMTTHAIALGSEIEAALAQHTVLPEPASREEEAILDDGWRNRISALYGHLGIGYVAVGRGWFGLVEKTLEAIDASLRPEDREGFRITDIKEKYGSLRIYCDGAPDQIDPIIEVAERRSAMTCDRCGDHGRIGGKGWLSCRCARHSGKRA